MLFQTLVESDNLCVNTDYHVLIAASLCDLYNDHAEHVYQYKKICQDEPRGLRKIEYSFKVS